MPPAKQHSQNNHLLMGYFRLLNQSYPKSHISGRQSTDQSQSSKSCILYPPCLFEEKTFISPKIWSMFPHTAAVIADEHYQSHLQAFPPFHSI
uniref:Uncharacterized protein n=1 Tax=Arundo donax TaxID=35708 RepID=A0A0A9E542_ARUDO